MKSTARIQRGEAAVLSEIPGKIRDSEILRVLHHGTVDWKYIQAISMLTRCTDETISDWLNISVRTLRKYREPNTRFKENLQEQVLLILSLFKHGKAVFGSMDNFEKWLATENFFFDQKPPSSFLNTVTGVRFVDERLTAMEYGDNV